MSYMKYDIVTITLLLGDGESCSHLNDAPRSCEVMSRFFLANFYVSAQNSMATLVAGTCSYDCACLSHYASLLLTLSCQVWPKTNSTIFSRVSYFQSTVKEV